MDNNVVDFDVIASDYGDNLYNGDCFEECLSNELIEAEKYNSFKGIEILLDSISKCEQHPQDVLYDIFVSTAKLDYDFAKQLNRLDIVNIDCFSFETDKGKAMSNLIKYSDLKFIVSNKEWNNNSISLFFEVVHSDRVNIAIHKINSGEYY